MGLLGIREKETPVVLSCGWQQQSEDKAPHHSREGRCRGWKDDHLSEDVLRLTPRPIAYSAILPGVPLWDAVKSESFILDYTGQKYLWAEEQSSAQGHAVM